MVYNDGLTVNMQLREEIVKTVHLPQTPPVNNSNEWAIYGWMCYFWMNVSFMDKRAVPFLDECAISGWICNFWMNGLFMDECAIYGWICHFWMNVPFLEDRAIFGGECVSFGRMCSSTSFIKYFENSSGPNRTSECSSYLCYYFMEFLGNSEFIWRKGF